MRLLLTAGRIADKPHLAPDPSREMGTNWFWRAFCGSRPWRIMTAAHAAEPISCAAIALVFGPSQALYGIIGTCYKGFG
ncbi:MAG: hypothetical protein COB40_13060 [Marinosulfonomonas sp.]|nr:MAG: hypothetical protein COB40_13060 [Marinosulfonomonas sp.]